MMVRRMNVPSISEISAPRNDLKTCSAWSTLVLYVTETSWRMCCPSRVGRSTLSSPSDEPSCCRFTIVYVRNATGYDCTEVMNGIRHTSPCGADRRLPVHTLKTTPTLPGVMTVNELNTAAASTTAIPNVTTQPIASGTIRRTSFAI